jgi:cytochrome oxidase Cu insertion factor (SCO1/SenC/PrrC family)
MKLQEKLDAYKKGFLKKVPEDALSIMKQATEDLKNSGIMDQTIKVGQKAPDFELKNVDGKKVVLSELLKKGPVVLGFYRGKW